MVTDDTAVCREVGLCPLYNNARPNAITHLGVVQIQATSGNPDSPVIGIGEITRITDSSEIEFCEATIHTNLAPIPRRRRGSVCIAVTITTFGVIMP